MLPCLSILKKNHVIFLALQVRAKHCMKVEMSKVVPIIIIDETTSRSHDVTNIVGFWSKRAAKTIEVNGNRVEFCFYFSMYR